MTFADLARRWKITKMETWDQPYVDLVVPGFMGFEMEDSQLLGQFQFGTVTGWMDCRVRRVGLDDAVEWA